MPKNEKQSKKRNTRRKYSAMSCPVYGMTVARGGSYLASTVTDEGRARQLQATIEEFGREFDKNELQSFLEDIREWLAERRNSVCVNVVDYYLEHGTTPPIPEPVPYGKLRKTPVVATVKAVANKQAASLGLKAEFATAA